MAWIESHQDLATNPKTKRAARQLGVSIPTVVGHLHCLWHWALSHAFDGDLSPFDAEDIAEAAMWDGDAEQFVAALRDCGPGTKAGFLAESEVLPTGIRAELALHDWDDFTSHLREKREASQKANHVKWHENRGVTKPDCPHCEQPKPDHDTGSESPPSDLPADSDRSYDDVPAESTDRNRPEPTGDDPRVRVREANASLNGFGSGLPRQPADGRSLAGTVQDWLAEPPRDHHISPRDKRSDDYRALIEGVCEHVDMRLEGRQVLDVVHRITCEYVAEVRGEPLSEVGAKQVRSFIGEYSKRPALALWGLAEAAMHGAGLTDEHAGNPQAFPNYARKVIESGLKAAS